MTNDIIEIIAGNIAELIIAVLLIVIGYLLLSGKMVIVEKEEEQNDNDFLVDVYEELSRIQKYMEYLESIHKCKVISDGEYKEECDKNLEKLQNLKAKVKDRKDA